MTDQQDNIMLPKYPKTKEEKVQEQMMIECKGLVIGTVAMLCVGVVSVLLVMRHTRILDKIVFSGMTVFCFMCAATAMGCYLLDGPMYFRSINSVGVHEAPQLPSQMDMC
ncbi:hypothetical protein OsI_32286 [Oryza sativa Indica Group]|uniref:Uncharacterized protein n=1 Tax=Oryza sativa subsp. indica TaxID=39946 RepID=B8BE51_ORYSI|nr:hypothetical protein OsI_32286 [Oryza sativa Indica Group]